MAQHHRSLKVNEERLEILQMHVKNIQKKKKLSQEMAVCLKKKAWIEFEEVYLKCEELNKDLGLAKT